MVAMAMGLDQHQPYLLLWAASACRDGASPTDVLALLGALGYTPVFRWSDPGQGREVFNPVSILCSTPLYLVIFYLSLQVEPVRKPGDSSNWAVVAAYPAYGAGAGGWRDALTVAGNQRVRDGSVGFWEWLVTQAQQVPKEYLVSDLPVVQ